MSFDEELARRVRDALAQRTDLTERRMFGGLAFMVSGNMCCGVIGKDLMLRLGPEAADAALDEPHTRPMDFTGRPMTGFIYVSAGGTATDQDLERWTAMAVAYATSLPPK